MGFERRSTGNALEPSFVLKSSPSAPAQGPRASRKRLPLGSSRRRLSYDLRLRLWLWLLASLLIAAATLLAWQSSGSTLATVSVAAGTALVSALAGSALFEQLTRPLQTLANVVAALRDDDFSFRARGARRGDSLGDLALEVNALAGTLQAQRTSARDALSLAERVMGAMRTPVLAFTAEGRLRLLNPAAESAFLLTSRSALGQTARALDLESLWNVKDESVHAHPAVSGVSGETRWSVRRSNFRLGGVPHVLFVLSDVHAALREEERVAWQRLVRVLSHEINNSLTPITSLAGSLRARLNDESEAEQAGHVRRHANDLRRGLHLIEDRALALHRFLQAYQQLSRLPAPTVQQVSWVDLVERVLGLERRVPIRMIGGPEVCLAVDPAQVEQLLINLLRNAAEAAFSIAAADHAPEVTVAWSVNAAELILQIDDNGPGLTDTANLFVPFYTTKPEGSGIGLALAKQIATGHGGTLALLNKPGKTGCVAQLHLPTQRPAR